MDFEINLNKSLSSFDLLIPSFLTASSNSIVTTSFSDQIMLNEQQPVPMVDINNNTINNGGNNYICPNHQSFKLNLVCIECTCLICPCCSNLPIHKGHQHLEVDTESSVFKKIYYCMTNCKEKIDNVMEIAMNEFENIKDFIQDKEININHQKSINDQVEVFLDFIDLAIGFNKNDNNINYNF